ncbi:hypothetical protein DXG03_004706, partial [Asterophora parasitica]
MLPMGWANSVPVFYDNITYILQDEILHNMLFYIDDTAIKGPRTWYLDANGNPKVHPVNPSIRWAIYEFFQVVNWVLQCIKYSGGTFSGKKLVLCMETFTVLGHLCMPSGQIPSESKLAVLENWGPCQMILELRMFLRTIGVLWIFIKNFAHCAHYLIKFTYKDTVFEFGPEQHASQLDIIAALCHAQPLVPINYNSDDLVILAVDTSYIAIGFFLCQADLADCQKRRYNWFGSIMLNDQEFHFSQLKLEFYGLYHVLGALCLYVIGIQNLVVKVNACYIK